MQAESVTSPGQTRLANAITRFNQRYRNFVLFAMLLVEHALGIEAFGIPFGRVIS